MLNKTEWYCGYKIYEWKWRVWNGSSWAR